MLVELKQVSGHSSCTHSNLTDEVEKIHKPNYKPLTEVKGLSVHSQRTQNRFNNR